MADHPTLSSDALAELVARVFQPSADERTLGVLVDLPDATVGDTEAWRIRREMALGWVRALASTDITPSLVLYRNAHTNNGDLPPTAWVLDAAAAADLEGAPASVDALADVAATPFEDVLARHALLLAPTQLSATAPLKVAAPRHGFRAATMPGFGPDMIPALRLDYVEINRRVHLLKALLDEAVDARFAFVVDGDTEHTLRLDLRYRTAHASGGVLTTPGTAGNLPSGETYIVPY